MTSPQADYPTRLIQRLRILLEDATFQRVTLDAELEIAREEIIRLREIIDEMRPDDPPIEDDE